MKKFLLWGFISLVFINLIGISLLLFQEGYLFSKVLFPLSIISSVIAIFVTANYWYEWNKEEATKET